MAKNSLIAFPYSRSYLRADSNLAAPGSGKADVRRQTRKNADNHIRAGNIAPGPAGSIASTVGKALDDAIRVLQALEKSTPSATCEKLGRFVAPYLSQHTRLLPPLNR